MKGASLVTVSALFFATYGIWSKLMLGTFGEYNQATVKAIILLSFIIPYAFVSKTFKKINKRDYIWFFIIASVGGLNQAPYYFGFEHLTVGSATLLFYSGLTLGAYILGAVFFKEEINLVKKLALIIAFIGLSVIYRFEIQPDQIVAAFAAFVAGIMGSAAVVFSKKLSGEYSEVQIVTGYIVAMIIFNPLLSFFSGEPMPQVDSILPWFAQFAYAVSYLIANLTVVAGFKYLDPSVGALIGLLEVIFAAIMGILIFNEVITLQFILGSILILFAISLNDLIQLARSKLFR